MSLWRQIRLGLKSLLNQEAVHRDIDDETQHYLEEATASLKAKGLSAQEARRMARLELGSEIHVREQVRDQGWENPIAGLIDDCRFALRRLGHAPTFAVVAILTLSLGIGATTSIFTVIDAVLLRPLPFQNSDRLVALMHTAPGVNIKDLRMAPSLFLTYQEESRVFEDISMWNGNHATVSGIGDPEEVPALFVTHSFLNVLNVHPALGRGFAAADGDPRGARTVLLSDAYWSQRFGAKPNVLGQTILVDGNQHEVIGVLPKSFEFMDEKVSLMIPVRLRREEIRLIEFSNDGVARLKPGVTLEQANADIARCLPLAPAKFPINQGFAANAFSEARISPRLRFLKDHLVGDIGNTLWILMGAVAILMLIACANVANLLLVRADSRQQELAVRAALGASRGRLARDLLAESLILGIASGFLSLAFCFAALQLLAHSGLDNLPRLAGIAMNRTTVAFAFATSIAASLVFGLIPVWKYARPRGLDSLRSAGRTSSQSRERRGVQRTLVIVQVALAIVLLVGSGLMIRTFEALRNVDPGFSRPEHVQAIRLSIPRTQVVEPEAVMRLEEAILRKFEAISGVESVAIANSLPLEGGTYNPAYVEDQVIAAGKLPPVRSMKSTSPGFAAVLGSRFLAGRDFTWSDLYQGKPVVLISENMAREYWRDPQAALGKRIKATLDQEWRQVVGVVSDLRDDGITRPAPKLIYWPLLQRNGAGPMGAARNVDFLIRTPRAGSAQLIQDLQQALRSVNANIPLSNVRTLGRVYERSMARTSFALVLLALAGFMALLLGVIGIYGVIAYSVAQRRRDIGIRIALGSPLEAITGLFLREGLLVSGIGAACGMLAAFAAMQGLTSLLFGVGPNDPLSYLAAITVLLAAALLASWLPARRAAAVDPCEALRAE